MKNIITILLIMAISSQILLSQSKEKVQLQNDLNTQIAIWNLEKDDIKEIRISDQYRSKHNGVEHIYVNQLYEGIEVYNSIIGLHYKGDKLVHSTNNFVSNLKSKIRSKKVKITAEEALNKAALEFGVLPDRAYVRLKTGDQIIFDAPSFAHNQVPAQNIYYYDHKTDEVRLAWSIQVDLKGTPDYWHAFVDAADGKLIAKHNFTLYCSFEPGQNSTHVHTESCHQNTATEQESKSFGADGAQYRVYAWPAENPLEAPHNLIIDPALELASPFGWHDTDGVPGPEFTITRGNNVNAFLDQNDDNQPDVAQPNGGDELIFDFVHKVDEIPDSSINADVTNMFYFTNFMHDFSYVYGFDEAAGNFQENNYGNGGNGSDGVNANAHDSFLLDGEDQGLNNATFGTPSDGANPTMNMFQWTGVDPNAFVRITEPVEIEGDLEALEGNFGRPVTTSALDANIVVVNDGFSEVTDACEELENGADVNGSIAMIDRGRCEFGSKALNAQNFGAVAVIICNVPGVNGGTGEELINMGGGEDGNQVTVPVIAMKKSDCDLIKMVISGGTNVIMNLQRVENENTGPAFLSSSFDNGIIAHEFGHGISNRLTGGPAASGCLSNDEQMGEGWSDFFSLITSHMTGDEGVDRKGIGNYVATGQITGRGIRSQPYSNDMSINNKTYNNARGTTAPHPLGEVWAATLWDMYWAFIDIYGYDPDFTNPSSGNSRAIQLVMDGMKFQRCSPGFLDGRDGILAADDALFDGAHQCLIWDVFARRGQGFDAVQGSSQDRNDNEEGFESLPICIEELKINKQVTDVIVPGDIVDVKLTVINHRPETLTNVTIVDRVPTKLDLVEGSVSAEFSEGNTELTFNLGTMEYLEEVEITYQLESSTTIESETIQFDDFEDGTSITLIQFPIAGNSFEWELIDFDGFNSNQSWFIQNDTTELDQALSTVLPWTVAGERPVLKFSHKYDTEQGFDGGFVEISTNQGATWQLLPKDAFINNPYNSGISFFTFAIPSLEGFTGDSNGWIESMADLSQWLGQDILIRFRFGSDAASAPTSEFPGWYIDNFELLDLSSFDDGMACVTSDQDDEACDSDPILVNTMPVSTSTNDVLIAEYDFKINPNPTSNVLNFSFNLEQPSDGSIEIYDLQGKRLMSQRQSFNAGINYDQIAVSRFPDGTYLLQLRTNNEVITRKFIKH